MNDPDNLDYELHRTFEELLLVKAQLAEARASLNGPVDRLLLNAYGRRCYDAGRDAARAQLAVARALLAEAIVPLEALYATDCPQGRGFTTGRGYLSTELQRAIVSAVEHIRAAVMTWTEAQR